MKKIAVFFADGFEEVEALTSVDVLRRANFPVEMISIDDKEYVTGSHGVVLKADAGISTLKASDLELIVCPGGMPGAKHLAECARLNKLIAEVVANGGRAAAICAAPIALAAAGVLAGHRYTCYPGFEAQIGGSHTGTRVEVDGKIITGCGPGASLEFALTLVRELGHPEIASTLAKGMLAP